MDATALARAIRTRALSAVEVMRASLSQIARINPKVNAICTLLDDERLLGQARAADRRPGKSQTIGPLHGFPHAVKDLVPTAGIRIADLQGQRSGRRCADREEAEGGGRDHHREDQHAGVEIVGRHHRDVDVLKLAYAFEQATKIARRRPPVVG